jgi:hypothetical protein
MWHDETIFEPWKWFLGAGTAHICFHGGGAWQTEKNYCFFHILWLVIGEKHVLSKKKFSKFLRDLFWINNLIWAINFLTVGSGFLTVRPFDRIAFQPNAVWPKVHFTERSYNRFFSENGHLTESTFAKKCNLTEKTLRTRSFDRKFISPKVHLNESFFWK